MWEIAWQLDFYFGIPIAHVADNHNNIYKKKKKKKEKQLQKSWMKATWHCQILNGMLSNGDHEDPSGLEWSVTSVTKHVNIIACHVNDYRDML